MNMDKIIHLQRLLDKEIESKHPTKKPQDRLEKKIVALIVESAEMIGEHRGFKFWSMNKKPKLEELLTECVDVLHFIVGIAIDTGTTNVLKKPHFVQSESADEAYITLNRYIQDLHYSIGLSESLYMNDKEVMKTQAMRKVWYQYLSIIKLFGFSFEQIEEAYIKKNRVNHERQATGY